MSDDDWRAWFRCYFWRINEKAHEVEKKYEDETTFWKVASCIGFVGFMYWLGWCTHG